MTLIILPFTQSNANNAPIAKHDTTESKTDAKRQGKAEVGMLLRSGKTKSLVQNVPPTAKDHMVHPKKDNPPSHVHCKAMLKVADILLSYPSMKTRLQGLEKDEDIARVQSERYLSVLNKISRFPVDACYPSGGESLPKAEDFAVMTGAPIPSMNVDEQAQYVYDILSSYKGMKKLLETRQKNADTVWDINHNGRIALVRALESLAAPLFTAEVARPFLKHRHEAVSELRKIGIIQFSPRPRCLQDYGRYFSQHDVSALLEMRDTSFIADDPNSDIIEEKTPPAFPCTDEQLTWFALNDSEILQELCRIYPVHMQNKINTFKDKECLGIQDKRGFGLLHLALLQNSPFDCVKTLILMAPLTINCLGFGCDRASPLMLAIADKNLEIVRILLEFGAPFNTDLDFEGWNVMHYAAACGNAKCADLVVNAAKKNLSGVAWHTLCRERTDDGDNPMDLAEKFGSLDTIPPALKRVELQSIFRCGAGYRMSQDQIQSIVRRSDLNWVDSDYGYSPLFWAIKSRHKLAVVKLLIDCGCDPEQKDDTHGTLLQFIKAELSYLTVIIDTQYMDIEELKEMKKNRKIEIKELQKIGTFLAKREKTPKRTRTHNHLTVEEQPCKRGRKK